MPYVTFMALLLLSASVMLSLDRQLQTLQQNSYNLSKYIKWIISAYTTELALTTMIYCALTLFILKSRAVLTLIVAAVLLGIRIFLHIKADKKDSPKLIFTDRVKRLYITAIVVLGICLVGSIYASVSSFGGVLRILCVAMSAVSPLLTLVIWLITYPIEKALYIWCVNDAKKILSASKDLKVIAVVDDCSITASVLKHILSESFSTVCTPKNFNTLMGVVRTIRSRVKPRTKMFVCEMNTHDTNEICDLVNPNYAVIATNDSETAVNEIANRVCEKDGFTLVSKENLQTTEQIQNVVCFGEDAKYQAKNIIRTEEGTSFDLCLDGTIIAVNTEVNDEKYVKGILAAASMARVLGIDENDIKCAIGSFVDEGANS